MKLANKNTQINMEIDNNNNKKSIKFGNNNNNSVEININESNKGHNQIQSPGLRGETMIYIYVKEENGRDTCA